LSNGPRAALVEEIGQLLSAGANVSLLGAPQVGKSYIGRQVRAALADKTVVPVDASTSSTGADAFAEIGAAVLHAIGRRPSRYDGGSLHEAWAQLASICAPLDDPVIIAVDEFDAVTKYPDAGDFLRHLRQLLSSPSTTNCQALLVSRRPIPHIEEEVRGISTLAGVCYSRYVRPLGLEDLTGVNDLAEPSLWGLEAREALISWSGGLPSLVKYRIVTGGQNGAPLAGTMDDVRYDAADLLVRYLTSLRVLNSAAQLILGPAFDVSVEDQQLLARLGFVSLPQPNTDAAGQSMAGMQALRDRLESVTRDSNAWGAFGAAERALREIVDTVLTSLHGLEWRVELTPSSKSIRHAYEGVEARQEQDESRFGQRASWLAYTYPGELWSVISEHWISFQPVFSKGDKRYWRERCEGLASLRAPMAHNRGELLGEGRRLQVLRWSQDVLEAWEHYQNDLLERVAVGAPSGD
jgi:hypothetical protein